MLTINFNHSAKNLSNSLGMSKDDLMYAKLALMFSSLSPKILATQLFDNQDEAPESMTTLSGCLETLMPLMKTDSMTVFALLHFNEITENLLGAYAYINDKDKVDELFTKENGEEENEMIKALKKLALEVKLTPIRMLSEYVRDANGDFDKFYNDIKVKVLDNPDNADLHKLFNTDED